MHFDDINHALPLLAGHLLDGPKVGSRLGEVTRERTMQRITLGHPTYRYVTVEGRRVSLPAQIAETMWVLAGRNDIEWLAHYLPRAAEFSDDGETWRGGYGPRLRYWETRDGDGTVIDQLGHVVSLLREDANTRRAVMNIYDPAVDSTSGGGKDIPCNNWLHFLARGGKLDLHVATRSNDLWWGWSGINAFEWSALLEVVARLTGLRVGELHFSISSLHLYERHWPVAGRVAQRRVSESGPGQPFDGPSTLDELDAAIEVWFTAEARLRAGLTLDPEHYTGDSMLDEWLNVLDAHWNGQGLCGLTPIVRQVFEASPTPEAVADLRAKRIHDAHLQEQGRRIDAFLANQAPGKVVVPEPVDPPFIRFVDQLHREKGAAYGDSWKKRGEQISILANVYRKVDRLQVGGSTADETSADTAIDLLVYLIKYRWWLTHESYQGGGFWRVAPPVGGDLVSADEFDQVLGSLRKLGAEAALDEQVTWAIPAIVEALNAFDVECTLEQKANALDDLLLVIAPVAVRLWEQEEAAASQAHGVPGMAPTEAAKFVDAINSVTPRVGSKEAVAKDVEAIHRVDRKHSERNATRRWNGYGGDDE